MHDTSVDGVFITERVNGWWVSVRYASGHEEHHGPYLDEDDAREEADILAIEPPGTRDTEPATVEFS